MSAVPCYACKKDVYPHERLYLNSQIFHYGCARCVVCKKELSNTNFAVGGNTWYCKTHFKQAFVSSGGKYPGQDDKLERKPTWKETISKMEEEYAKANPVKVESTVRPEMSMAKMNTPIKVAPPKVDPSFTSQTGRPVALPEELEIYKKWLHQKLEDLIASLKDVDGYARTLIDSINEKLHEAQSMEILVKLREKLEELMTYVKSQLKPSSSSHPKPVLVTYEAKRQAAFKG